MTVPLVAIFCMVSLMFLLIGGIVGWLWKEHVVYSTVPQPGFVHPEMFDRNGNIIPDEILAVRFENDYGYEEDDDHDDD
jgi:hypothetical protein